MIIMLILAGVGALAVIAMVVGVIDARRSHEWRRIAAERRYNWEVRQALSVRGPVDAYPEDPEE